LFVDGATISSDGGAIRPFGDNTLVAMGVGKRLEGTDADVLGLPLGRIDCSVFSLNVAGCLRDAGRGARISFATDIQYACTIEAAPERDPRDRSDQYFCIIPDKDRQ
jgi:hypothetical protein